MKLLLILWAAAMINAPAERHYVTTGTAINDHEFVTPDGNAWSVYDALNVGELYTIEFADNATKNIEDNNVISIYKEEQI